MKTNRLILLLLLFSQSRYLAALPQQHDSGLLVTGSAVAISQSDFNSGTYRITQPNYYYLAEDITFEPDAGAEAGRSDKPATGWFTAISIEADNVILDLNTKTLEASQDFVDNQTFKVFSLIELNNSPFPHFVFAFPGETALKNSRNAVIKNGTLGRSSHHGIHGNSNVNVQIYDMVIRDWEVAGISLNGLQAGSIRNCIISGIEHAVPFTGLFALMNMARMTLETLVANSDPGAQAYLDDLNVMLADSNQNGTSHNSGTHDGNAYGIFINRTLDVGPVITHCDETSANCITIENCTVCNINSSIIETVGIQDSQGTRLKGETFGVMRWVDAYPNGTFAPNALLKAQVYGVQQNNPSNLPTGFAANILAATPDEATFLSQVSPIFTGDFAGHTNKGAFGIRVDCGHGVTINNCNVMAINNKGVQGAELATLDGGSNYSFTESRYTGNDVYGISLAACHNCKVENSCVTECSSDNGYVFGVTVMNESQSNLLAGVVSSDHYAKLDNTTSSVNPSSSVFGFYLNNSSNSNSFESCISQSLEAPRYAYGFYVASSGDTGFVNCTSTGHNVYSTQNLSVRKEVAGFASFENQCTLFKNCEVHWIRALGETAATAQTASRAAGFLAGSLANSSALDEYLEITQSKSSINNGGSGIGAGILLDGVDGGYITNNVINKNFVDTTFGQSHGIYQGATNTNMFVVSNQVVG